MNNSKQDSYKSDDVSQGEQFADDSDSDMPSEAYELTIKKGILAVIVMYACQIIAGAGVSYMLQYLYPTAEIEIEFIGLFSILISGVLVLLLFWWDLHRSGTDLYPQIGLQSSTIKNSKAVLLVVIALAGTHFLAWIYRSVILPMYDQGGIIGGGSKMFSFIQENGSGVEMTMFLVLALVVGPVMEEVVFRGYLQSSLAKRLPVWVAIVITSFVFMAGHNPMVLWPMYFMFSAVWGWVYVRTGSLKMAILIHVLSNLYYTIIGFAGWDILA